MKSLSSGLLLFVVFSGCSSTREGVAAPAPKANGTIGAWQELETMPVARANHCAVAANGYVVVIGGNYRPKGAADFVRTADVHVAKIGKDGALGPWSLAGKAKSPVYTCTAASDGKDVFLVDGIHDDDKLDGRVARATLADDGTLSGWQDLGALPDGVRALAATATVENGSLRILRSKLPEQTQDGTITNPGAITLLRASVGGDALGAWEETSWLEGFRGYPQLVFAPGFVFALGGYATGASEVLDDGAGAAIDTSGKPGTSFPVAKLPKPTTSGRAAFVDGWLFVTGGKDKVLGAGASGRADVFAAKVGDDGSIAEWKTLDPMPQGRTSHAVVVSGEFLYVTGGGFDSGGLDTVYSARVRFAPTGSP